MRALVVLLSGVDPVVSVQLVRPREPPSAGGPRAHVRLVADMRPQVRAQVRGLLVLARALWVVAEVEGALVRVAVRVLAADATALFALSLLACNDKVKTLDSGDARTRTYRLFICSELCLSPVNRQTLFVLRHQKY